jgi:putative phosphoesterase
MRIGLISDTHNLLREEALAILWGCDHIIHAGDIGSQEILDALSVIAPVAAVRGNNDKGAWANTLPEVQRLQFESTSIYVVHDMAQLDVEPLPEGINVVICGHSHRAVVQRQNGVIYVNPGSAGPHRFNLPITVAELVIKKNAITPRIVSLDVAASTKRKARATTRQNSFI